MSLTEKEEREMFRRVERLHTVLLGANGDEGLIGDFKEMVKRQNEQEERQDKQGQAIHRIYGIGAAIVFVAGIVIALVQVL